MTNTQRDEKIIEQAKSYLSTIANSDTLRERIMKAVEANTLKAYWDLQDDLTNGSKIQKRFLDYHQDNSGEAIEYTRELATILRGERLENN